MQQAAAAARLTLRRMFARYRRVDGVQCRTATGSGNGQGGAERAGTGRDGVGGCRGPTPATATAVAPDTRQRRPDSRGAILRLLAHRVPGRPGRAPAWRLDLVRPECLQRCRPD